MQGIPLQMVSRHAVVVMVQAAEDWRGDHLASFGRISISGKRHVSIQRQVRSGGVVVIDVFSQHPPQVTFVENDHMVETLAANRAG